MWDNFKWRPGIAWDWLQGTIDRFDSYRSSYYLSAILVIILDIISAMRIKVVYAHYTHAFMAEWEIDLICAGLVIMNYLIATHRHFGIDAIYTRIDKTNSHVALKWARKVIALGGVTLLVIITLAHDVAAVLWNFLFDTTTGMLSTAVDARIVAGVVAGLVIVPFLIGHHMIAVKEAMPAQDQKFFAAQKDAIKRRVELRALRLLEKELYKRTPQQILGQAFINEMEKVDISLLPEPAQQMITAPQQPAVKDDNVITGHFATVTLEGDASLPKA